MPETIDEEEFRHPFDENIRVKIKRQSMQTGPDEIAVHVYQEYGEERHRVSRFRVEDEEDQIAYYVPTRGRSEPWSTAIHGLQEYGWDCSNFDLSREDSWDTTNDTLEAIIQALLLSSIGGELGDSKVLNLAAERAAALVAFIRVTRDGVEMIGIDPDKAARHESVNGERFIETIEETEWYPGLSEETALVINDLLERFEEIDE